MLSFNSELYDLEVQILRQDIRRFKDSRDEIHEMHSKIQFIIP
jgi:hypothetical protein